MVAVAALIVGLLVYLLQRMPSVVELGGYLAPIKAATQETSAERLAQPMPGFQAVSVSNEPRLDGFKPVRRYRRDVLEQTVYDGRDGGRIVLLSAPARTRFSYGTDRSAKTEVSGIRCEKVDSRGYETYAFYAGGRHYVLIGKACTPEEAGAVMRQLGALL